MKRFLAIFMMLVLFVGLAPLITPTAEAQAQTYLQRYRDSRGRIRYRRVAKPSYYRRHRNRINVAAGTGAGALIGAIAGGKKGALIGGAAGAGGSALYTYVFNKKKRKYVKVRRY